MYLRGARRWSSVNAPLQLCSIWPRINDRCYLRGSVDVKLIICHTRCLRVCTHMCKHVYARTRAHHRQILRSVKIAKWIFNAKIRREELVHVNHAEIFVIVALVCISSLFFHGRAMKFRRVISFICARRLRALLGCNSSRDDDFLRFVVRGTVMSG